MCNQCKKGIEIGERTSLYELVDGEPFKEFIGDEMVIEDVKPFDRSLVPSVPGTPVIVPAKVAEPDKIVEVADKVAVSSSEPVEVIPTDISEAEARAMYIDLMLRESGWKVLDVDGMTATSSACVEVELHGMPCEPNVAMFIRSVIGVDRKEAVKRFSTYMMPLAKYIDNIHNVIDPEYFCA